MNVALPLQRVCGCALGLLLLLALAPDAAAQFQNKWLAAGTFHNWYSEIGSEREHGNQPVQQFGWRWPGLFALTDMQAARALWIGARNVTDHHGTHWPVRVVHVGPRVTGGGEFFPVRFELITRRDPTVGVRVDEPTNLFVRQPFTVALDSDDVDCIHGSRLPRAQSQVLIGKGVREE
jgi:hypothetical protein